MPALMHAEPLSSAARSFASSGVAVSEVKVLVHILKVQQSRSSQTERLAAPHAGTGRLTRTPVI